MHQWQRNLVQAYRWASLPYRALASAHFRRRKSCPIAVLFYHRVADSDPNPWTMSCHQFREQIDWMSRRFEFISLDEVQRRLASGCSPRPAVSITFDDGYAENAVFALPYLIRHHIPVTYFVTLENLLHDKPFPHDEALGLDLPRHDVESIRMLSSFGIEIGAHTRTHPKLTAEASDDFVQDEVAAATDELAEVLGKPVRHFAIPYGRPENLDPRIFEHCAAKGMQSVCSAHGGLNFPGDPPFYLRRIHGDPELVRMKNWLTYDPRVILQRRRQPCLSRSIDFAAPPQNQPLPAESGRINRDSNAASVGSTSEPDSSRVLN